MIDETNGARFEQPKNLTEREAVHEELETRLPEIDVEVFRNQLVAAGGEVVVPSRVVASTRFKIPGNLALPFSYNLKSEIVEPDKRSDLKKVLAMLGFEVADDNSEQLSLVLNKLPENISGYTLRHNRENDLNRFTVKGPEKKLNDKVKDRPEEEVDIANMEIFQELLQALQVAETSYREKTRENWALKDFPQTSIVIDKSGNIKLRPWAEVESPSVQEITEVVKKIGYQGPQLAMSESEYFKQQGLTKEEINNIRIGEQKYYAGK